MKKHPSGQPQREPRRGTANYIRPPRDGFLIDRLNMQKREGGFGFQMPPEPDDPMYFETWASRRA